MMPSILISLTRTSLVAATLLASTLASAQARTKVLNIVLPTGPGRIVVPLRENLQWNNIGFYNIDNKPARFAFEATDTTLKLEAIFSLTASTASAKSCRDEMLLNTTRRLGQADAKQIKKSELTQPNGSVMETASFTVDAIGDKKITRQNQLAVYASPTACAAIHIAKLGFQPADQAAIDAEIAAFTFEPAYIPTSQDYFALGAILYRVKKAYAPAVYYYQRALETLPADAPTSVRRVIVDQLSTSYRMTGQLKPSRDINEAAIKTDPDYPTYYYNLACVDAEQGDAKSARVQLQKAFDLKANVIAGEQFPDPTQDPSILKLKNNAAFWTFVQTLK